MHYCMALSSLMAIPASRLTLSRGRHASRGPPLHISFDMIRNQATNLSDSKIPHLIPRDSCDSNDSKQDSVDS